MTKQERAELKQIANRMVGHLARSLDGDAIIDGADLRRLVELIDKAVGRRPEKIKIKHKKKTVFMDGDTEIPKLSFS